MAPAMNRTAPAAVLFAVLALAGVAEAGPDANETFAGWHLGQGRWTRRAGALAQTSRDADCRAFAPSATWGDYTLEVLARKTGGSEGFLLLFRVRDREHFYWWNVAGWGNSRHAIETRPRRVLPGARAGGIRTGRWYRLRVTVAGDRIRCWLDDELIHDVRDKTFAAGGVGLGSWMTAVEYRDLRVTAPDGRVLYAQLAPGPAPQPPAPPTPAELARARRAEAARFRRLARRCPPVAYIARQPGGRRGTNATMHARRTGVGSAIRVFDPAEPNVPPRTIFEDREGFIFDMTPTLDGRRLLFSRKRDAAGGSDPLSIYEIGADGTGLRRLTRGRYHDFAPVQLPDGRIAFTSTRCEAYSMCQDYLACALYVMDADGGDIRRVEYNTLCDLTPWVLHDGSLLFTRWEYQDKNIFCTEGLWTIYPDGTRLLLYYGNTLTIPNAIYGARQVPGRDRVVCVMAAHHHPPIGGIAVIDRGVGLENPAAMRTLTPDVPYRPTVGRTWKDTNWGPGDRFYRWAYTDPWPLAEDLFLVSYGGGPDGPHRFDLYLLDDRGRKARLHRDSEASCYSPVALAPRRPRPHRLPGSPPARPAGEGRFFVQDVYQGLLGKGVRRGDVAAIRVCGQQPKKYNTEGPRFHDHYPVVGFGSYYTKICYGEAPVSPDGSAYFIAPAGVELYFEAVDDAGREIRRMGTVTQLADGERQSCIGCHESRFQVVGNAAAGMKRLSRPPDRLDPPPWGTRPIDFIRDVQPVFDRHCVRCHAGRAPKAGLDFSAGRTRLFNMAYRTCIDRGLVDFHYINTGPTGNFPPLASGSRVSKLVKVLESRRCMARMSDDDRRRIYLWIDLNCNYYGTWDMSRPHSLGGRDAWVQPGTGRRRWVPATWFTDLQATLDEAGCRHCHAPYRPGRQKGYFPETIVRHTWINLTRPEHSRLLNAHLAKAAGGMGLSREKKGRRPAVFADTADPLYRAILRHLRAAKAALEARPRMDMPGGKPIPQQRDFGRTF